MIKIAIYVSNHGYGHAARMSALAEELGRFGVFCHVIYMRSAFLFNNLNHNYAQVHHRAIDTGVKHKANLVTDLDSTRKALLVLLSQRNELMAGELEFLRKEQIDLIISDAPYLVSDFGSYTQIPVYCVTNFEWHYIYSGLYEKDKELSPVLNLLWALYQRVDACFRLPLSSNNSMAAFKNTESCGLLARRKSTYANLRKQLGWPLETRILLVMFGGEGAMEVDFEALCKGFEGKVISATEGVKELNHHQVQPEADFLDLIYNADIVLCKPGYSTLAEALQFGKFILYCPRTGYPEEIALINGIEHYPNRLELKDLHLSSKQWKALFARLKPIEGAARANGNCDVAGKILAKYIGTQTAKAKLLSVFDLGTNNLNYALYNLDTDSVIHKTQVTTGLGKGFNGEKLSSYRIARCKQAIQTILELDAYIMSEKVMIATGVSRVASNANLIKTWVESCYALSYKLLSAQDEIRYVYHAAKKWGSGAEAIAVDIGGASTELVYLDRLRKEQGISLPLGLMTLFNSCGDDINKAYNLINKHLNQYNKLHGNALIGVGLTYCYLAAVVYGLASFDHTAFNGLTLPKDKLQSIAHDIDSGKIKPYLPFLLEKRYLPILRLSLCFNISLLDKLGLSEIIVCSDGISVGYAKARFLHKTNKGSK